MKKLKKVLALTSAFMLLSSIYFTSCSSDDDDDNNGKPTTSKSSDKEPKEEPENPPSSGDEKITPAGLSSYYKEYFFGGAANATKVTETREGNWDSGAVIADNADGSVSVTSGTGWGENPTVSCVAYGGITPGYLARYTYLVLTADLTNFTLSTGSADNDGANIKIASPDAMKKLSSYGTTNTNGTVTYILPISDLSSAATATKAALIFGGTGTVKFTEFYVASKTKPAVDKSALNTAINSANECLASATIGEEPGNYSQESVDTLNSAITLAQAVADKNDATQTEVDEARTTLLAAVDTFKASAVPDKSTYEAPDLTSYYKKYFVTTNTDAAKFDKNPADWSSGAGIGKNADGTLTLTNATSMWNAIDPEVPGVVAAFSGLEEGTLSNYEYIVLTLDMSNFTLQKGEGNNGVNIKIPEIQKPITDNWVKNSDETRTYYAKISEFTSAATATEFALIAGGTGKVIVKEIYVAAAEDPANKAVTGITLTSSASSVKTGEKVTFTVKDSNLVDRTSEATYELSGDAATGSAITAGVLTAGTTAGQLKVTAKYSVGEQNFTAEATISVLGDVVNLVKTVALEKYTDSTGGGNDKVSIENGVVTVSKPAGTTGWGDWSSQLFLTVSAESGNIFETGKKYYIAVTVESDADLNGCIWKGDDAAGYLLQQGIQFKANEAQTLKKEIEFTATFEKFQSIMSFGNNDAAATIKVSDFTVYDITENASGEGSDSGNTSTSINWSEIDWVGNGSGDDANTSKYKISAEGMSVVNIQKPAFANEAGIYISGTGDITACTLGAETDGTDFAIQGGGIVLYLSKFTAKETKFTVTNTDGTHNVVVFYADGAEN